MVHNQYRKNHAYNQRTKRLRDTSEGETLYFIEVYGQRLIMTFGKYLANGRDRPVTLQFKFFPTDRALSILRGKTGQNFPNGTVQIFNKKIRALCPLLYSPGVSIGLIRQGFRRHLINKFAKRSEIIVFVRKPGVQITFSKIEYYTICNINGNVKILGRRLYSPSLKDVVWLDNVQLICLIFHAIEMQREKLYLSFLLLLCIRM